MYSEVLIENQNNKNTKGKRGKGGKKEKIDFFLSGMTIQKNCFNKKGFLGHAEYFTFVKKKSSFFTPCLTKEV